MSFFKNLLLRLPGTDRLLKYYRHHRTSCYVLSYPKSGRTWLRVLLAKSFALHFNIDRQIVFDPDETAKLVGSRVPRLYFDHGESATNTLLNSRARGKLFSRYRYKKVILLVRDPRDVLVSYWFHRTKRLGEQYELSDFIRHSLWGIDRIIEFMNGWYNHMDLPASLLLVRYEDMQNDACKTLRSILQFLGLANVSDAVYFEASEYASFNNMRRLSLNEFRNIEILKSKNVNDTETYKVRRGKVGGYVDYLSTEDIKYLNDKIKRDLNPYFGYS